MNILSNAAATGAAFDVPTSRSYLFTADGTFGGATVKLQVKSPDGSSWIDVAGSSLTSEGAVAVTLGAGQQVRCAVAGGSPSALYASIS